jgi:sialic acid synthase SpsE
MRINGRDIGPGYQPYIIGEVSGEHRGSKDRALDLILALKDAGADAAKFQLFDPVKLSVARGGKHKVLTEGLWKGRTLLDLYTETFTPRSWFPDLFAYAKEIGITLFSSVFDEEGVDYLETLGCPAYKVSSFSVTDLSLIRKAASTGKPIIISTGMADNTDVSEAFAAAVDCAGGVALLHCVSDYPCRFVDAQLWRIDGLEEYWSIPQQAVVGLSDHTLGTTAAIVATALGASIIEKHITLDRNNGGPDAAFSLEPAEFAKLVRDVKDAYASLGTGERPKSEDIYRDLRHGGSS